MTKLNEIELDSIKGGTNVTGPVKYYKKQDIL